MRRTALSLSCFACGGSICCLTTLPSARRTSQRTREEKVIIVDTKRSKSPLKDKTSRLFFFPPLLWTSLLFKKFHFTAFRNFFWRLLTLSQSALSVAYSAEMPLHDCGPLGILWRSRLIKSNLQSFRRFFFLFFKENALKGNQQHVGRCSLSKLKKLGRNIRYRYADRLSVLSARKRGAPSSRSSQSC